MTIISFLVFIVSTIGVAAFACWDNDIEIPFLYTFGAFEAEWWFHDKLKPGRPHLEQHDKDGPPLVAAIGTGGGPIPWPYPGSLFSNQPGTIPSNYDAALKMKTQYTPVDGMFGVTKTRENDPTSNVQYYPNASDKNNYIAQRLLGPQADWTELEAMGDKLRIFNTKVFPSSGKPGGSPW